MRNGKGCKNEKTYRNYPQVFSVPISSTFRVSTSKALNVDAVQCSKGDLGKA
jgi:hypothetical protein